jgi:hypothetical protein
VRVPATAHSPFCRPRLDLAATERNSAGWGGRATLRHLRLCVVALAGSPWNRGRLRSSIERTRVASAAPCSSYRTAWYCCRTCPLRPPSLASGASRHPSQRPALQRFNATPTARIDHAGVGGTSAAGADAGGGHRREADRIQPAQCRAGSCRPPPTLLCTSAAPSPRRPVSLALTARRNVDGRAG